MDELVITGEGVQAVELVEMLGEERRVELDVDDPEDAVVVLRPGSPARTVSIPIGEFVTVDADDDGWRVRLDFAAIADAELVRRDDAPVPVGRGTNETRQEEYADPPAVPSVEEFKNETRRGNYAKLGRRDTMQWHVRQIIWQEAELTRRELFEELRRRGYSPDNSGTAMGALTAVAEVTGEVEREGRGIDSTLRWAGAE